MIIQHDKIILTKPEKGVNLRKIASMANVMFFWMLTLYIMRSLFMVLGWFIISIIFDTAFNQGAFESMIRSITHFYIPLILCAAFTLWAWANYNKRRYGGKNDKRRVHPPSLSLREVSEYTGLSVAKLEEMREAKRLVCHFNTQKEVERVDCWFPYEADEVEVEVEVA